MSGTFLLRILRFSSIPSIVLCVSPFAGFGTASASLVPSDYSVGSSWAVSVDIGQVASTAETPDATFSSPWFFRVDVQAVRSSAGMAFTGVDSKWMFAVDAPAAFVPIYDKSWFSWVSGRRNVADLIPAYPKRPSSFRNVSDSGADEWSAFVKFKIMAKRFFVW